MKRLTRLTSLNPRGYFAALASVLALIAVPATAGIANTKHNLSPTSGAAAGTAIDYDGASGVLLVGAGESAGRYKEFEVKGGKYETVTFR